MPRSGIVLACDLNGDSKNEILLHMQDDSYAEYFLVANTDGNRYQLINITKELQDSLDVDLDLGDTNNDLVLRPVGRTLEASFLDSLGPGGVPYSLEIELIGKQLVFSPLRKLQKD